MLAGAAVAPLAVAGAVLLYTTIGAPGYPDMPLAGRFEAARIAHETRPAQAEAEAAFAVERPPAAPPQTPVEGPDPAALNAQLRAILEARPDDLQGHRFLVTSEIGLGNLAAAHRAQARVIALLGDQATADDHAAHAELMIAAAGGFVSPEAEAALQAALDQDPQHGPARFLLGLMAAQSGRWDVTFNLWSELLAEAPADAPWRQQILGEIETVAALAGVANYAPPPAPAEAAGPSAADIAAAADLPPEERDAMIRGMVEGLAARLANQGGPARDWARLIGALVVLGETERATAIWGEAQAVFGARPEDLALIAEAAQAAGLAR